jgi:hypothetical protein
MTVEGGTVGEMLKSALQKIGVGLLYGIGIGASFGAITVFMTEQMTASMWNDAALEKVVVAKHEEVRRDETVFILGTVENRSAEAVRAMSIQIDLFDKDGKFVDQCSEYLRGALKPAESRNFKVSCGGCKDRPAVAHASYKVRVIGM